MWQTDNMKCVCNQYVTDKIKSVCNKLLAGITNGAARCFEGFVADILRHNVIKRSFDVVQVQEPGPSQCQPQADHAN